MKPRRRISWTRSAVIAAPLCLAIGTHASAEIEVTNFRTGETIRYTTPLIRGTLTNAEADSITLVNRSSQRPSATMSGLAHAGRFKVLADLVEGQNDLELSVGNASLRLQLIYKPQTNPLRVQAVYLTDHTGVMNPPEGVTPEQVRSRVGTLLLPLQSFVAEEMRRNGYGRRTFNLELDETGRPRTWVVPHVKDGGLDFGRIRQAIENTLGRSSDHYMVILDPNIGYTARGGGGLGVFGGAAMFSWPDRIEDVQAAFMDATAFDPEARHGDAGGRGNFHWANTSNCYGAALHELIHSWGVTHSFDPHSIMYLGLGRFSRLFTLFEPITRNGARGAFSESDEGRLTTVTTAHLAVTRHFALDERPYARPDEAHNTVEYDREAKVIRVTSRLGIGAILLEHNYGNPYTLFAYQTSLDHPPHEFTIPAADWERFNLGDRPLQIRVFDVDGHHTCVRNVLGQ